jgi:hypothetical protein
MAEGFRRPGSPDGRIAGSGPASAHHASPVATGCDSVLAGPLRVRRMAQGSVSVTAPPGLAGARELLRRGITCRPAASSRTAASCSLRRQVTAGVPVAPRAAHLGSDEEQGHESAAGRPQSQRSPHRTPGKEGHQEYQCRKQARANDRAFARRQVRMGRRIGLCRPGLWPRRRCGQPGRNIGGNQGQFGEGARSERLADPGVELILGHQAVHVCGLERVDHVLTVGVGRPQAAVARQQSNDHELAVRF